MSFLSNLREKWRRHDEKLAEQAYENRDTDEQLEEHGEEMNRGLVQDTTDGGAAPGRL